ncbi:MAG: MBL fold metallo-hydrolase, partial [Thermoplasmata archaeon]
AVYLSTPAGVLVVFGCGHAGVINTLEHAKQLTGRKIFGVFGGTHLVSASDEEIREVVEYLNAENVEIIRLSHCTGKKAEYMLQSAFGKKFAIFPCGEVEIVEF